MTSKNDHMNMDSFMKILNSTLSDILTGVLKSKYAEKAITALSDEKAQESLIHIIQDNMPTKVINKSSKTGGKRRKKDPTAPKKNSSAYIFFCKKTRADVKASHPDMKGTDVTKELGRIWREDLDDEDKVEFIEQATEDKTRYDEEMKDYTPSAEWISQSESSSEDDGGKKKKNNRKSGPKRAIPAFMFFCKAKREEVKSNNQDMDAKDVTRELGRIWREDISDDEKKPFTTLAENDKIRYIKEKEEWTDPESTCEDEDDEKVPIKSSKKLSKSSSSKKEKPKKSSKKSSSSKKDKPKKSSKKSSSSKKDKPSKKSSIADVSSSNDNY